MPSQKHMVNFVNFIDDGGEPVLVMEYMPLSNLTKLQKISYEEVKNILRQALQASGDMKTSAGIRGRNARPSDSRRATETLATFGVHYSNDGIIKKRREEPGK